MSDTRTSAIGIIGAGFALVLDLFSLRGISHKLYRKELL